MVCVLFKHDIIKVCSLFSKKAAYAPKKSHVTQGETPSDGHAVHGHSATHSKYRLQLEHPPFTHNNN